MARVVKRACMMIAASVIALSPALAVADTTAKIAGHEIYDVLKDFQTFAAAVVAFCAATVAYFGAIRAATINAQAQLSQAELKAKGDLELMRHQFEMTKEAYRRQRVAFARAVMVEAERLRDVARRLAGFFAEAKKMDEESRDDATGMRQRGIRECQIAGSQIFRSPWADMALLELKTQKDIVPAQHGFTELSSAIIEFNHASNDGNWADGNRILDAAMYVATTMANLAEQCNTFITASEKEEGRARKAG